MYFVSSGKIGLKGAIALMKLYFKALKVMIKWLFKIITDS